VIENEKRENMEILYIFKTNIHLKNGLGIEFTDELRPADARGSAGIFYRMTHIATLQVRHSYVCHKICHAQNI